MLLHWACSSQVFPIYNNSFLLAQASPDSNSTQSAFQITGPEREQPGRGAQASAILKVIRLVTSAKMISGFSITAESRRSPSSSARIAGC